MTLADMIPTLDDAALASLQTNAKRLEGGVEGPRRQQAIELLPLIEAELDQRRASKPAKPARRTKAKAAAVPPAN